jgi:hypothetical protein
MLARVSNLEVLVTLTWCFVMAGTQTATAQALCPEAAAEVRGFNAGSLRDAKVITVQTDLGAFSGTLPGGTWRMPNSAGLAWDGIALEGVSFTGNTAGELDPGFHTFRVVVDLRGGGSMVTDLEFVAVDGQRSLPLGTFTGIAVHCEATSVSGTFLITDHDFVSFFARDKAPALRVKRTTRADGC